MDGQRRSSLKFRRTILAVLMFSFLGSFVGLGTSNQVTAKEGGTSDKAKEEEKRNEIVSQNCSFIKTSLGQLQKVDSRTRVYLGTAYERVFSQFMIPLNVRLTKNGTPSTTLTALQADFGTKRNEFTGKFTDYMKKMDELIAFDCQTKPEEFYNKLGEVRVLRKELNTAVNSLNGMVDKQITEVKKMEEKL